MRLVLGTAIAFLVVFLIVVMIVSDRAVLREPATITMMGYALDWTVRLFGALTAVASAIGFLLIAATKGPMERQIALVLPLLAGLLLLSATWSLGVAVGAVAVAWLLRKGSSANS
jgi:hypothetical protein